MKIQLISYKQDSILDSGFFRFINFATLFALVVLPLCNENEGSKFVTLSLYYLLFICLGSAIIPYFCIKKVIKDTIFYEWDYTERKKKEEFLITYTFICIALSVALCFSICFAIKNITNPIFRDIPLIKYGSLFPPLLFIFNLLNIPSLFNLSECLKLAHKIQKKPDNWQEDGPVLTDEDMIKDIYRNDFGVEL